jgi:hypothetical protein
VTAIRPRLCRPANAQWRSSGPPQLFCAQLLPTPPDVISDHQISVALPHNRKLNCGHARSGQWQTFSHAIVSPFLSVPPSADKTMNETFAMLDVSTLSKQRTRSTTHTGVAARLLIRPRSCCALGANIANGCHNVHAVQGLCGVLRRERRTKESDRPMFASSYHVL